MKRLEDLQSNWNILVSVGVSIRVESEHVDAEHIRLFAVHHPHTPATEVLYAEHFLVELGEIALLYGASRPLCLFLVNFERILAFLLGQ